MRILHLTLKKKWFDMTDSGEKTEDYRDLTPYWYARLCLYRGEKKSQAWWDGYFNEGWSLGDDARISFIHFDAVFAMNGYNPAINPSWTRVCLGITISEGRKEWGAEPGHDYFVIKISNPV